MYLYGAGGHTKVIIDILRSQGKEIEGLFDDNPNVVPIGGYPICDFSTTRPNEMIVSIGDNEIRKKIVEKRASNIPFGTGVHSSAIVSPSATIGEGTVVMQGAVVQSSSSIGNHCIVNTLAGVDHDCVIEDYVHICPDATLCGSVSVGEGTMIGAGSTVIQGISIGKWSIIAAGSVVTKPIPDGVVAAGNPCRIIRKINKHQ